MKTKILKRLLCLLGLAALIAGCETDTDYQRAASVSGSFAPIAPTPINDPQLGASGSKY